MSNKQLASILQLALIIWLTIIGIVRLQVDGCTAWQAYVYFGLAAGNLFYLVDRVRNG